MKITILLGCLMLGSVLTGSVAGQESGRAGLSAGVSPATEAAAGKRPNTGFANHGNYCGPGWSGGEWITDSANKEICKDGAEPAPPLDETDALCLEHDRAYCMADAAEKARADEELIAGFISLRPILRREWEKAGCSGITESGNKHSSFMGGLAAMKGKPGNKNGKKRSGEPDIRGAWTGRKAACLSLRSRMAYGEAAIAAFTVKRALYKRNILSIEDVKKAVSWDGQVSPFRW